ncbi:MAG: hypothetical protein J6V04_02910 [Bacteroidales bacterium]|nr:hypothetical protein [Bacteroidales bacterium]
MSNYEEFKKAEDEYYRSMEEIFYLTQDKIQQEECKYIYWSDLGGKSKYYRITLPQKHNGMYVNYYKQVMLPETNWFEILFGASTEYSYRISISIGKTLTEHIHRLTIFNRSYFTEDSIKRTLNDYPHILSSILSYGDVYKGYTIQTPSILNTFDITISGGKDDNLSLSHEQKIVSILLEYAEIYLEELRRLKFDPSLLVPIKKSSNGTPTWVKYAVKAGVKITIATLAGFLASKIDLPDWEDGDYGDVGYNSIFDGDLDFSQEDGVGSLANVSFYGDSDQFWINEKKSIEKEMAFCENQMNTNNYIQSASYKTFIDNKYAHALNKLKEVLKHI